MKKAITDVESESMRDAIQYLLKEEKMTELSVQTCYRY